MNNELKYPVKYAVLVLKRDCRWASSFNETIYCYIVSKCFVVGENIKYYSDGSSDTKYNVVFPYQDFETFKNNLNGLRKRIVPEFDYYGNVRNFEQIDCFFDDYESAKIVADEKNADLLGLLLAPISMKDDKWVNKINTIKNDFSKVLEKCNLFEQCILEKSVDMDITDNLISNYKKTKK